MRYEESKLQAIIVKALSDKGYVCIHPANERHNGIADATRMRSIGVTKGAYDLICLRSDVLLLLELKTDKGSLSIEQEAFRDFASTIPYAKYKLVRSLTDIKEFI